MATATENLGSTIRSYRKLKNYSTQELAESLDVSTGFLNNLEHGKNDVFKLDLLMKIVEKLEIPLETLLENDCIEVSDIGVNPLKHKLEVELLDNVNNSNQVCESIESILAAFLDTLKAYDYDTSSTKKISSHIINILVFIKNLKSI